MRTNYILIDFENVQPASFSGLESAHFRVLAFVDASQAKLGFDTAPVASNVRRHAQQPRRRSHR